MNARIAFVVGAFALLNLPGLAAGEGDVTVRYQDERLTVRTKGAVTARRVLEVVSDATKIEFLIDPKIADGDVDLAIEALPVERALARVVAAIPETGGHTLTYTPSPDGPRLARLMVFHAGRAGTEVITAPPAAPRRPLVPAPTPSIPRPEPTAEDFAKHKAHFVSQGMSEEDAQAVVEVLQEMMILQKIPGAIEAFVQTDRYREVMHRAVRATGKGAPVPE